MKPSNTPALVDPWKARVKDLGGILQGLKILRGHLPYDRAEQCLERKNNRMFNSNKFTCYAPISFSANY